MKIRIIKKKLKAKAALSAKEKRLFVQVIGKCKSIRNTISRGMILSGHYNGAINLMIKHGDVKLASGWEINE